MAYATADDVKKVLGSNSANYPSDIEDQQEFSEGIVDGALAGVYDLRFDDATKYASVPVQIKWIAALLVAWRLWDKATVLEGQADDTAAAKWRSEAYEMLEKLRMGEMRLTLEDGTVVGSPDNALPRSYPEGVRDKADSADNNPLFTRDQAGKW